MAGRHREKNGLPLNFRSQYQKSEEERFFEKVDKTPGHGPDGDCWIWTGSKTGKGYGGFRGSTTGKAHIWMYQHMHGDVSAGLEVMHSCDEPACVNPDHLTTDTHHENILDCVRKGRSKHWKENGFFGENHRMAKLDNEKVLEIRKIGYSQTFEETAKQFGVSKTTVSNIINRKRWAHL